MDTQPKPQPQDKSLEEADQAFLERLPSSQRPKQEGGPKYEQVKDEEVADYQAE